MLNDEVNLMLGDADGVVCVSRDSAEGILVRAKQKKEAERRQLHTTQEGNLGRGWVDALLKEKGCEFVD